VGRLQSRPGCGDATRDQTVQPEVIPALPLFNVITNPTRQFYGLIKAPLDNQPPLSIVFLKIVTENVLCAKRLQCEPFPHPLRAPHFRGIRIQPSLLIAYLLHVTVTKENVLHMILSTDMRFFRSMNMM
jgi:hypothetical protein